MSKGKSSREKFVVEHANWVVPDGVKEFLRFVHLDGFTADWEELDLCDDDLRVLEVAICLSPTSGAVMRGTGGLRKMRFAPPSWHRGRRGALRVLYAIFPDYGVVVLAAAYAKGRQGDIDPSDRVAMRELLADISRILEDGGQ